MANIEIKFYFRQGNLNMKTVLAILMLLTSMSVSAVGDNQMNSDDETYQNENGTSEYNDNGAQDQQQNMQTEENSGGDSDSDYQQKGMQPDSYDDESD